MFAGKALTIGRFRVSGLDVASARSLVASDAPFRSSWSLAGTVAGAGQNSLMEDRIRFGAHQFASALAILSLCSPSGPQASHSRPGRCCRVR